MGETLPDLVRLCTVRVATPRSGGHGTGFFVAPSLILTCAHLVEVVRQRATSVEVYWNNQSYSAQIVTLLPKPYPDLALLRVDVHEHPCVYLHDAVILGDPLYSYGYTDDYPDGDSATLEYEGPTDSKRLLLKLKAGQVRPGLSGAPLLNLRTGGVCGIVKSTRERGSDLGGRAVPTSVILSMLNDVLVQQRQFHQRDPRWINLLSPQQRQLSGWQDTGARVAVEVQHQHDLLAGYLKRLMQAEEVRARNPDKISNEYDQAKIGVDTCSTTLGLGDFESNPAEILDVVRLRGAYLASLDRQELTLRRLLTIIQRRLANLGLEDGLSLEVQQLAVQDRLTEIAALRERIARSAIPTNVVERTARALDTVDLTKIKANIENETERIFNRFVSGSNRIKIESLFDDTGLFVPFRWKSVDEKRFTEDGFVDYVLKELLGDVKTTSRFVRTQRFLVLADPGVGKSTATYRLFSDLTKLFLQNRTQCVPVHIDLREYTGDIMFGSKEWVANFLDELGDGHEFCWFGVREHSCHFTLVPFIILDSLDEYLSTLTASEAAKELNRFIFKASSVITCRTQYFERYLSMSNFSSYFQKLYLLPWTDSDRKEYTDNYVLFCFPTESRSLSVSVNRKIEQSPQLKELCQVPLRLNMTLELLSETHFNPELIEDLLSLYHAYIHNWLTREASKLGNILDIEEKFLALEELSWHFYDEGRIGENSFLRLTRTEVMKLFQENRHILSHHSIDGIVDDLSFRSILLVQTAQFSGSEPTTIRFIHKSFQEYFVARYLYHAMTNNANTTSLAFRRVVSQEVGQFLKEYIKRINRNPVQMDEVVENCISAFKLNQDGASNDGTSKARLRISRQQLAYYMGHIKSPKIFSFLSQYLDQETDLWTKRSITIGLAFSGHDEYLHKYIDRLRDSRKEEGNIDESDVNIGFHLSYFGDQPYDELYPEKDQGVPKCENTVRKLIYQLGTEINRDSWRLDLYTLIDIAKYRDISYQSCVETLKEHVDEFERIIEKFKQDESCSWWPEITEAEDLIQKLRADNS